MDECENCGSTDTEIEYDEEDSENPEETRVCNECGHVEYL